MTIGEAILKHERRFLDLFGVRLRPYCKSGGLGFDILRFDDEIVRSGERPFGAVVKERWGDEALALVQELAVAS